MKTNNIFNILTSREFIYINLFFLSFLLPISARSQDSDLTYGNVSEIISLPSTITIGSMRKMAKLVEENKEEQLYAAELAWIAGKRRVKRKLFTKNGNLYKYNCTRKWTRYSAPGEDYTNASDACIPYSFTKTTISCSKNTLSIKLEEQIQVAAKSTVDGHVITPSDPIAKHLGCKTGSKSFTLELNGLVWHFTSTCSHIMHQTPRRTGRRGRDKRGNIMTQPLPGTSGDPYAPWRIKHIQTITIQFAKMAKLNNMSTQELALELIKRKTNSLPSYKDKNNKIRVIDLDDEMRVLLMYFLWKSFDHESALLKEKKNIENEILKKIDDNEFDKATIQIIENKDLINYDKYISLLRIAKDNESYKSLQNKKEKGIDIMYDYVTYLHKHKNGNHYNEIKYSLDSIIKQKHNDLINTFINSISIETPKTSFLAYKNMLCDSATMIRLQSKEKLYNEKKVVYIRESLNNITSKTPIHIIDSLRLLSYNTKAESKTIELSERFADNYKLNKGEYIEHKGIWYKVLPSKNEVEVSINRKKSYKGSIVIPELIKYKKEYYKVTGIGKGAFYGSRNLKHIELPNSIKYIDDYAFSSCSQLLSIQIPKSVTNLGIECFANCTKMSYLTLSESIKFIPNGCFFNCNLKSVTIPEGIEEIGETAFYHNLELKNFYLPNSLKIIGVNSLNSLSDNINIICEAIMPPKLLSADKFMNKANIKIHSKSFDHYSKNDFWCLFYNRFSKINDK